MKLSLRIDKRYQLANGKYPVKIAVARNGRTMYLSTGIEISESDWDKNSRNMEYVKNLPNRRTLNLFLRSEYTRVEKMILELQLHGELKSMSNRELLCYLSKKDNNTPKKTFKHYAEKFISERKSSGTKVVYNTSLKAFSRHYNYDTFLLREFTKPMLLKLVNEFSQEGIKTNSIYNYISNIRAIYNYALSQGEELPPFPKLKMKKEETRKRSLTAEQLRLMKQCEVTKAQKKFIDIFFLSLYMRGINMVDLSELSPDDVNDGYISYKRNKTGKQYYIKMEEEISEIIERYRGEKHLLKMFDKTSAKVFGVDMGVVLKKIASKAGIKKPVSPYWARHTWATLAIEIGGSMEMVSAGLGHSFGAPVTNIYIAYNQKKIDELSRSVMDYVLAKGKYTTK